MKTFRRAQIEIATQHIYAIHLYELLLSGDYSPERRHRKQTKEEEIFYIIGYRPELDIPFIENLAKNANIPIRIREVDSLDEIDDTETEDYMNIFPHEYNERGIALPEEGEEVNQEEETDPEIKGWAVRNYFGYSPQKYDA